MSDITNFLPGNTHITLVSTSILCLTSYLSHTTKTTHIPYLFLLNLISIVSISAYIPLILVKAFERFKLYVRSQVLPTSTQHKTKKSVRRESIWRKWINNSEFLLCLTIFQFSLTCGYVALSLLSLYTMYSTTSPHTTYQSFISDPSTPSKTVQYQTKVPITSNVGIDDILPLLFQFVHMIILSIQLISFLLIIIEIRGSLRYSSAIDKSLAGLLEKDINELIRIRVENRNIRLSIRSSSTSSKSRWHEKHDSFGQSSTCNHANPPYSPIRNTNDTSNCENDGTPRRRSRTISSNQNLITPTSVPLIRQSVEYTPNGNGQMDNVRFIDPFLARRSSRGGSNNNNGNGGSNRRLSVRFDLTQHLTENKGTNRDDEVKLAKYVVTPSNEYTNPQSTINANGNNQQDYFSLPIHPQYQTKEMVRPIPLSIIKSPKDNSNFNFSPISNGSDTLHDIIEEEDDVGIMEETGSKDRNNKGGDKAWMDVRGDESV